MHRLLSQSESGHSHGQYNGNYAGYQDQSGGLYHPGGSPGSNFGRYREGSFGQHSGLESGRASTIGTDHMPANNMPQNSSRVALNSDWRNSYDQGSDMSRNMTIAEIAPGKEGYGRADSSYGDEKKDPALGGNGHSSYAPIQPGSPAVHGPPKAREAPAVVISRTNRLEWIDGVRGLASIIIFTHHFADLTWAQTHPNTLAEGSLPGFLRNGQLAIGIYFILGGRVLAASFLKSAFTVPKAPVVHGDDEPEKPVVVRKPPGPRWLTLSSSLFRRSIRLAFPAIIVGFIQWRVCRDGLMTKAMQAEEEFLSPSALWEPTWCAIGGNFADFLQFCLDLFTNPNRQYMLTVGSALWSTYDQFWGSVLVYILAGTLTPLPFRGRYTMYLLISVALWWINSSNMLYVSSPRRLRRRRRPPRHRAPADSPPPLPLALSLSLSPSCSCSYVIGLWIADFYASGFVRKIQDHWKLNVAIEFAAGALALAMIAGGEKVATPANRAVGSISVYDGKYSYNPSYVWPQYMLMSNWCVPLVVLVLPQLRFALSSARRNRSLTLSLPRRAGSRPSRSSSGSRCRTPCSGS